MFSKAALIAFALMSGSLVEGRQANSARGLSVDEFMKAFDNTASNIRGSKAGRGLQRVPGPSDIGDFQITEENVRRVFSDLTKGKDGNKSVYESCKELFKAFDANNDAILDLYELIALFQSAGFSSQLATLLAQAVLDWYDLNDDAGLDQIELEAACKGDPHFVTWYGSHYSYHGACDLILVQNPTFSMGKGLDLHVRTSHMMNGAFSFISNAALRIGKDVFEVVNDGTYFLNGVKNAQLPSTIGGFAVYKYDGQICKGTNNDICSQVTSFNIELTGKAAIRFKVASEMVHVDIKGTDASFSGSSGLMGTYPAPNHGKIARDGVTFLRDGDAFAEEWQVREDEPMLFQETRYPQYPQVCIPAVAPLNTERRMIAEDSAERMAAEAACAHVTGAEWEFCIFDVMATGDYGMAATIYGDN